MTMIDKQNYNINTCHILADTSIRSNYVNTLTKRVNQCKNCIYLYLYQNKEPVIGKNISTINTINQLARYLKILNLELDERKDNVHRSCKKKLNKDVFLPTYLIIDNFETISGSTSSNKYLIQDIIKDLKRLLINGQQLDIFVHIVSSKGLSNELLISENMVNLFPKTVIIEDIDLSLNSV